MNILYISSRSDIGGGPKHISDILKNNKNKKIFVAAPEDGHYAAEFKKYSSGFINIPHRKFSLVSLIKLIKFINKNQIAICHSHGRGAGIYNILLRLFTLKSLHSFHGIHPSENILKLILQRLEFLLLGSLDHFIFVSNSEYHSSKKLFLYPRSHSIISNGIELGEKETPQKIARIGLVARLEENKNIEALLNWHDALLSVFPDSKVLVAGGGPLLDDLVKSSTGKNIEFLGQVSQMHEYYKSIDLILSFSKGEGLPYSILEAMSYGIPVVASKVRGHTDLLEDHSLFSLNNKNDFIEKLNFAKEDYQSLSQSNKNKIKERFSLNKMVNSIFELYG